MEKAKDERKKYGISSLSSIGLFYSIYMRVIHSFALALLSGRFLSFFLSFLVLLNLLRAEGKYERWAMDEITAIEQQTREKSWQFVIPIISLRTFTEGNYTNLIFAFVFLSLSSSCSTIFFKREFSEFSGTLV